MYTTHSAVQLCTDCGNLSPSVSERSSLLSGARFARARVRRAANVRVYTPINVHHGCVHTPHSNPCASWSGWLALFPTIMRVLCARVCTKVDTRETEKRLPSNDAHDTEFNNPPRANTPTEISFYEIVFLFFCERRFLSRKTPISHVRTIQRLRMCREAIQRRHRRSVNARLSRLPRLAGLQGQEITLKRRWTVWHYASYWPTYHSVTFPPTKRVRYVGETGEKWATRVERS